MIQLLLRLHDIPGTDQFRIQRNKIITYAVGIPFFHQQAIGNMRNIQPFHQPGRKHLIIRLLLHSAAAALYQAALPVCQNPSLFQPSV